jgi:hypothetical protein
LTAPPLLRFRAKAHFRLLAQRAVPVNPLALKEAVTHHAVAEQKKDDGQKNHK